MRKLALFTIVCLLVSLWGCGGTSSLSKEELIGQILADQDKVQQNGDNTGDTGNALVPNDRDEAVEAPENEQAEAPAEDPMEEEPVEEAFTPYKVYLASEVCIFSKPDSQSEFVRLIVEEGVYTITEEYCDDSGFVWGNLKSGLGWVNLSDPFCGGADAPKVIAAYSSEQILSGDYHLAGVHMEDAYAVKVTILAHETVYHVRISDYNMMDEIPGETLYSLDQLDPGKPIVAHLTVPGDFSSYLVTYTDGTDGLEYSFLLWMSMDDSNTVARFW